MKTSLLLALLLLPQCFDSPVRDPLAKGGTTGPEHLRLRTQDPDWRAEGMQGAVAAGGAGSVAAGLETLKAGGNAADAAVATLLALTITDYDQFCFGGEVPILIYDAKRKTVEVLSGMGAAPKLATREYFEGRGGIPGRGLLCAAVPAALDACLTALDRHGTISFADAVKPARKLLDGQTGWRADLAHTLGRLVEAETAAAGDRSARLRAVADFFYRGPIATEIDAWSREGGGLLRAGDLAAHRTRIEAPLTVEYRGHTIAKCGPWTQGPWLLQALRLLEGFDLKALGHNSPEAIHLMLEAMKLAMADRDVHYGDPEFVKVPVGELLSKEYADLRRALIDPKAASLVQRPGDPAGGKALLGEAATRSGLGPAAPNDTTTCVVADRWGNVVAATPSGWSGVVAGRTGVWLGSRLQSFNTWKGHPNCIEPGKRPRITLTPTLVLKDGRPALAVSVAGGDAQDQVSLQILLNHIDFALEPAESVTAPRFLTGHYTGSFLQSPPSLGSLVLQEELGGLAAVLKERGHRVGLRPAPLWHPVAISIGPDGRLRVAGDPKARRHASAY